MTFMHLIELVYVSAKPPLPPGEIFRIQDAALRNNARDDLTGVLLFSRDCFVQCLEGEREQVTRTFATIADDDRHRQVALLHVAAIEERTFGDWSMGLLDGESPAVRAALNEIVPGGLLLPANLDGDAARRVVHRARTLHLTRR